MSPKVAGPVTLDEYLRDYSSPFDGQPFLFVYLSISWKSGTLIRFEVVFPSATTLVIERSNRNAETEMVDVSVSNLPEISPNISTLSREVNGESTRCRY